jgi:hypothetical protein
MKTGLVLRGRFFSYPIFGPALLTTVNHIETIT